MNWTRILTLLVGLALLASLPVGSEEALTGQSGVKVLPDTSIINPCQTGRVVMGSTTGAKYRCISAIWVKEEVPRCSLLIADPPSGSCSGTDMCLSKTDGTIYICNESNIWEAYTTGGGGSGSPGGATTQVQFNLLGAFAGDAHLTWNAGSDTLTATNISSATGSYQNLTASSLFRLPQDTGTGGHNSGDMRWYADIPYIYLGGAWRRIFNTIDEPVVMDDICLDDDEDGSACSVETDSSAKKITVQGSSSDSMQYKGSNFIYTKSGQTATVGFSNPPTGTRVLDFPDASGTIAVNGQAQNRVLLSGASYAISGDADLTFSGASNILSVGNVTDGAQILFGDTYLWRASDGELNIRHDGTNNSGLSIWGPLGDSDEAGINLSTDYDGTYSSYCHGMDIVSEDYDTTGWFGTDYEGLVLQRRCGRSKFNFEIRDWDGTSEAKRLNLDGNAALTVGSINLDATMDGTTDGTLTTTEYSGRSTTAKGLKAADSGGVPNDVDGDGTNEYTWASNGITPGIASFLDAYLRISGGLDLNPSGGSVPDAQLSTAGIFTSRSGLASKTPGGVFPATLRSDLVDTNGDGMASEPAWYIDEDGDGWYTAGERLLVPRWKIEEEFTDCNAGKLAAVNNYPWYIGDNTSFFYLAPRSVANLETDPTVNTPGYSTGPASACWLWASTNTNSGYSQGVAVRTSGATSLIGATGSNGCTFNVRKLIYFRARVCNWSDTETMRLAVGSIALGASYDMAQVTDGAFFWASPKDDVDGDSDNTAADADSDRNWWAVTAYNQPLVSSLAPKQLADGDSDGYIDYNLDGTSDKSTEDLDYNGTTNPPPGRTATDTGTKAGNSAGRTCYELAISYERGAIRFFINDSLVATHTAHIPDVTRPVCMWGVLQEHQASSASARTAVDYVYYLGRR